MKALTLTQPWATLIAIGSKRIETRSWTTGYRGPLAITAAKGFPTWAREAVDEEPFREVLRAAGYFDWKALPRGVVLCTTTLLDVWPTGELRKAPPPLPLGPNEEAFGDFGPGRFAWYLGPIERLAEPVPVRGELGLWEWKR